MLLSTIRLLPLPSRRLELLEILRSVQGPVLAQEGCLACRVYVEAEEGPSVLICERWDSEDHLQTHLRSDLYQRILAAIELSNDPPEVCFHHVSSSEGMQYIERARHSAEAPRNFESQPKQPVP